MIVAEHKVLFWLESEPDCTTEELLERLRAEQPSSLRTDQLRTLQQRVKEWRKAAARRLVFSEATSLEGGGPEATDGP